MKRRRFLEVAAAAAGGVAAHSLLLNLSGCGSDDSTSAQPGGDDAGVDGAGPLAPGDVLLGLYASSSIPKPEDAVRTALASLDLGWLKAGESVFVKLASNSGNAHPAVTSPAAVTALCAELFDRGAGRVVVGDQSGVAGVRLAKGELRFGSTKELMEQNGLYDAITSVGAEAHFFDDQGYEAGYFEATPPDEHHWSEPIMIPKIIQQVDHIVYLPRMSSHAVAGYSHGLKSAVGWLRDDGRYHLHNDAASLHEKYVEISYCTEIASRLRLVLTFAEAMLLDFGPDTGTVAVADPRIVIASTDIANHDALGVALLRHIDQVTPEAPGLPFPYGDGSKANMLNQLLVTSLIEDATGIPWGDGGDGYTPLTAHQYWEGIAADRCLSRAYALQGGVPQNIQVRLAGAAVDSELRAAIEAYSDGIFDLVG